MKPYVDTGDVQLYHGDCREILPELGFKADCAIADPPYSRRRGRETNCEWDVWPDGWLEAVAGVTSSMWCFGSMRTIGDRWADFHQFWTYSHEIVWKKQTGTGLRDDRFRRVHEFAVHWYRGPWSGIRHEVPRDVVGGGSHRDTGYKPSPGHYGDGKRIKATTDDGTRLAVSVISARNMHGRALHPTEKPPAVLAPMIEYACPPGGVVIDPTAGAGSTAVAARLTGRRAVLIEATERYCEVIATRLAQDVLPI